MKQRRLVGPDPGLARQRWRALVGWLGLALPGLAGCVRPVPLTEARMLLDLAVRYDQFHGAAAAPDGSGDAELVRPRLGLPAIARAGEPFELEWLERGRPAEVAAALVAHAASSTTAASCRQLASGRGEARAGGDAGKAGCVALQLEGARRSPTGQAGVTHVVATARPQPGQAPVAPGSYDLLFDPGGDAPHRVPRAVWLSDDDPAAPRPLRVALLSDLHVGKRVPRLEEHLAQVIGEVNRLRPDLVVVTGDLTNRGPSEAQERRAEQLLSTVEAPLLVVIGNHDHGFSVAPLFRTAYGVGYVRFSRAFHPLLYYELTFGGWRWVGFDSGPSLLAPVINNRGVAPETIARIEEALGQARREGLNGVVLFSHCASRASLTDAGPHRARGAFGRMYRGGRELEQRELAAAAQGQRVLHLSGHTHWSDLFEAQPRRGRWGYQLVPRAPLEPGPRRLTSPAAIVTVQSATHAGILKESARGYGYALLTLGEGAPEVEYVRHLDRTPLPRAPDPFAPPAMVAATKARASRAAKVVAALK